MHNSSLYGFTVFPENMKDFFILQLQGIMNGKFLVVEVELWKLYLHFSQLVIVMNMSFQGVLLLSYSPQRQLAAGPEKTLDYP